MTEGQDNVVREVTWAEEGKGRGISDFEKGLRTVDGVLEIVKGGTQEEACKTEHSQKFSKKSKPLGRAE